MLRDSAKASRTPGDLDEHFRHAPNGPGDVRDLSLEKRTVSQSAPTIADYIQQCL
jgi:hypothetical protein